MRALWLLGLVLVALPAAAEEVWILQTGPEAVDSIPLSPVQPVPAWRGLYSDGADRIWVYTTRSPHFFAPAIPQVRSLAGRWTVTAFFPEGWSTSQQTLWLDRWAADFRDLQSLPQPGWPVVFPAVLRKG